MAVRNSPQGVCAVLLACQAKPCNVIRFNRRPARAEAPPPVPEVPKRAPEAPGRSPRPGCRNRPRQGRRPAGQGAARQLCRAAPNAPPPRPFRAAEHRRQHPATAPCRRHGTARQRNGANKGQKAGASRLRQCRWHCDSGCAPCLASAGRRCCAGHFPPLSETPAKAAPAKGYQLNNSTFGGADPLISSSKSSENSSCGAKRGRVDISVTNVRGLIPTLIAGVLSVVE